VNFTVTPNMVAAMPNYTLTFDLISNSEPPSVLISIQVS
jgi:hypothetical protein